MAASKCIASGAQELAALLESAWPGVRINELSLNLYLGEARARDGELSVSLSFSGPVGVLVRHGLLRRSDVAKLPPSGVVSRSRFSIKRGKRLLRVACYWVDPDDEGIYPADEICPRPPEIQRIVDCTAKAIAAHMLSVFHG